MHVEERVGCWVPVSVMLHFTEAGFLAKSRTVNLAGLSSQLALGHSKCWDNRQAPCLLDVWMPGI